MTGAPRAGCRSSVLLSALLSVLLSVGAAD
jgi:hypothetical protein